LLFLLVGVAPLYAQMGIGTTEPKSLLHIVSSDPDNPFATDGVLIPRLSVFPTDGLSKGQLIFFNGDSLHGQGFYFWDGEDWESFIVNQFSRSEDRSIYVITGSGYAGSGTVQRAVQFNRVVANQLNGFSVANNVITVGKDGTYLINFTSALKKSTGTGYRATYTYRIFKNNTEIISSNVSIPNETTTAASISTGDRISLKAGDIINVTVQKPSETDHADHTYTGYGTNTITLTYLND